MPNESSGKDLQITCWSLLRQISPSWRNLRHKMSTSVKLFLFIKITNLVGNLLVLYSNSADFRRSFGGSISITAQCIETQLMPNEGSGKDLQITCWSLLRQISLSWCNLRHKVSTPVKLFLFILLLSFFLSFFLLATICSPYLNNWP